MTIMSQIRETEHAAVDDSKRRKKDSTTAAIEEEEIDYVYWKPDRSVKTNIDKFCDFVNEKYPSYSFSGDNYEELRKWSVTKYDEFWGSFWEFSGFKYSKGYDQVIDMSKRPSDVPKWFEGSRLNYAEQALKWRDDRVAMISVGELLSNREITYKELYVRVSQVSKAMKDMDVGVGDRVCGYMPNCIETTVFMLAASSLGAIWSSTSPDFGIKGVLSRFSQISPKLLVSVNAVTYNGKIHNHIDKVKQVAETLDCLEKVVIFDYVSTAHGVPDNMSSLIPEYNLVDIHPKAVQMDTFVDCSKRDLVIEFTQLPFEHPLFIMFSSGTTGAPKSIVHGQGGTLLQHMKEMILHSNLKRSDVLFYYTTCGWMMWNWLMGGLLCGSTIVAYDGSPFKPNNEVMFDLVDELGISIFGTSPKFITTCKEKGLEPMKTHKLSSLHTILSTGAPLTNDCFEFVYKNIKQNVLLGSIAGGTDIMGCFMGSNPNLPVVLGECQSLYLGMDVQCIKDAEDNSNQEGELCCVSPFPSQPVFFYNDDDKSTKYMKAYFQKYLNTTGIWCHGDHCAINEKTNGVIMLGRSDGTLNPAGVRFGSAEIYNLMDHIEGIQDTLCVGYTGREEVVGEANRKRSLVANRHELVVLFVLMKKGSEFKQELINTIKKTVRSHLSPRHVPAFIFETPAIPYTINGKKVEIAVKKSLGGQKIIELGSYVNPESLGFYYNFDKLPTSV